MSQSQTQHAHPFAAALLALLGALTACGTAFTVDVMVQCLCLMLAAGITAGAIASTRQPLWGLTGLAAAVFCGIMTRSLVPALYAIGYLPAAYAIAAGLLRQSRKTLMVVTASAAFGVFLLLFIATDFLTVMGTVTPEKVKEYVTAVFAVDQVQNLANDLPFSAGALVDTTDRDVLIEAIMSCLPGCYIALMLMLGYFSTVISGFITRIATANEEYFRSNSWKLRLSRVSAVIMLLSYLISMFLTGTNGIFALLLLNVTIMLSPGYYLSGLAVIFDRLVAARRLKASLIYIIMGLSIILSLLFSFLIILLICTGVFDTLHDRSTRSSEE